MLSRNSGTCFTLQLLYIVRYCCMSLCTQVFLYKLKIHELVIKNDLSNTNIKESKHPGSHACNYNAWFKKVLFLVRHAADNNMKTRATLYKCLVAPLIIPFHLLIYFLILLNNSTDNDSSKVFTSILD
jgi:hypothetical protein